MDLEHTASLDQAERDRRRAAAPQVRLDDARIIAPGHPERSVLLHRIAHRGQGSGQMPQLATNLVDEAAVKLFEEWIRSLRPAP